MDHQLVTRAAELLLADGRIASIRPMVDQDRDGLLALHDEAGDDSLRLRFFALPQVTAAAFYLESFGNAPKFARVARRFAERKPLLAVVGGRSAGGQRAGASHTAAAASPAVGIDALFVQAGVIPCHSAESMGRAALPPTSSPSPRAGG